MPRTAQYATQGYSLADARHTYKAAEKHWVDVEQLGATRAELKRFGATIVSAERVAATGNPSPAALEEKRQALKDNLGDYRAAATLVVHGIEGRDAKAEHALKMKGAFPRTDLLLAAYVDGLAASLRPYSVKLAARGYSKEKQAQLPLLVAAFKEAFAARGKERGAARSETLQREAIFKQLRTETSYFRRLGHEALRNRVARADFDRVKLPGKPVAVAAPPPAPAPAVGPARTQAA